MSLDELLRTGTGISVTVKLDDLRQLFNEIAQSATTLQATKEESPRTLTRKEALQRLGVDSSTL